MGVELAIQSTNKKYLVNEIFKSIEVLNYKPGAAVEDDCGLAQATATRTSTKTKKANFDMISFLVTV